MRTHTLVLAAFSVAGCFVAEAQTPAVASLANNAFASSPVTNIAPGELVNVNGSNLGDATAVSCGSTTGFTTTCGGVSLTIGGKAAGMRAESATQLIIQVPVDALLGAAPLIVTRVTGGQTLTSTAFNTTVVSAAPQMYGTNVNGLFTGNCFNSSNVAYGFANPALPGDIVRCIGTGFGVTNPVVPTGTVQPTPLPSVVAPVKVTIAGQNATVNSTTLAQGTFVGQYQVVFVVPATTPGGPQPVTVNVNGVSASPFNLNVAAVGPTVTTVVNSASNAIFGLPNAGVAPGSIIVAYGNKLGPDTLVTAPGYPWPANLSGTSATVTVGGKTVSLLLYYTSASQIAGLLPSSTLPGNGTISVTYNGVTGSSPASIQVLANNFGVYTVPQNGGGPAIVTFADYSLVAQTKAANPGETLIIWGTGLGAVSGDEATGPLPGDMTNLPVKVLVAGVEATVVYRGRSGCCVGEDQIAFVVPAGLTGCLVPLAVQVNNQVSNYSTIALAPSGRDCVPSYSSVPPAFNSIAQPRVLFAQLERRVTPPPQFPNDAVSADTAEINPVKLGVSGAQLNAFFDGPPAGSCLAQVGDPKNVEPPIVGVLDAGTSLTLRGPSGTTRNIPKSGIQYLAKLGDTTAGNFLDPGAYTLSGPGGADIGSFTAPFTVPQFTWTNRPANNGNFIVNRSQGARVTWTGGDPNGYVQIGGGAGATNSSAFVNFFCNARVADGAFTIPPSLLAVLPGGGFGVIDVTNVTSTTLFTATGLDAGAIGMEIRYTSAAVYQ